MDEILLVLPHHGQSATTIDELDIGYAHGIISHLIRISSLTILVPYDVDVRKHEDDLDNLFGCHVGVKSLTEKELAKNQFSGLRPLYSLPFLDQSMLIYQYLANSNFKCVIFDVFDATGFISIRAKKTGLGLNETLLISWFRLCHEFHQRQILEAPRNLWFENHINFAERYCCENSDKVIFHTRIISDWSRGQKWNIDPRRTLMLDNIEAGITLQRAGDSNSCTAPEQNPVANASNSNPPVSICVAHFNDGENLIYLLKSIAQSDYENFEVIVVDDGSTNVESLGIVRSLESEYAAKSWRFIMKEENESIGPTRNFAVSQSRGELIIFMDSDNLATKTMISDFVRGMLKSDADCLTCGMIQFKGEGGWPESHNYIGQWLPLGASLELGFTDNVFGDANFCIKKSVFEVLGGFCGIRGHVADDWEFLARLVLKGFSLDVVPKGLFLYRVRSGSWLQSAWSRHSIYTLRRNFLAQTGPEHVSLLHNLILQLVAENETFRSSVWKLDRKVVKIALMLSDIISEEQRLLLQEIPIKWFKRFKDSFNTLANFVRKILHVFSNGSKRIDHAKTQLDRVGASFDPVLGCNLNSTISNLPDSKRIEMLNRLGLPSSRPIFAFIGTLNEEHRPLGFLRLAYWLQMFKDDSFFFMVGDGPLHEEVQVTASKYKLSNLKWTPFMEEIDEFYSLLDGLVITGLGEKTPPTTMIKALSEGVPVFSTDVAEANRLLTKYGNGLVVNHDPDRKDFADSFKLWKDNLEIYKTAAMETAGIIRRRFYP